MNRKKDDELFIEAMNKPITIEHDKKKSLKKPKVDFFFDDRQTNWISGDEHCFYPKSLPSLQLRSLKKGKGSIAQLDCHGLTQQRSIEQITHLIESLVQRTPCTITLIVGKGKHCTQKPIIKNAVIQFLKQHSWVRAFTTACSSIGGSGVIIARLKEPYCNHSEK